MSNPETRDFSFVLEVPYYGRIAPDMDDIIFRYKSSQYDHIRYHTGVNVQTEEGVMPLVKIKALFVGSQVLDLLAKHGLPETYVDLPTEVVVHAYESDQIARFEEELSDEETEEG